MYNSYSALNLLGGMLYTVILLVVAYFVLKIVANWKIFEKAGQPGWASIVPFYSNYIEFNLYWGNGWLFLAFGHYEYHGIPQDGYSYSQLKTKYEEKKAEQQNNPSTVQYQTPETPKEPSQNVQYQTPNAPAEVKTPPTQQNQNQDNG